jgi:hypothetical protein
MLPFIIHFGFYCVGNLIAYILATVGFFSLAHGKINTIYKEILKRNFQVVKKKKM